MDTIKIVDKIKRCDFSSCNKILSLSDKQLICKCRNIFCKSHRFFIKHNCDYNFKDEINHELKPIIYNNDNYNSSSNFY